MQAFADLIERLDRSGGTSERVEALVAHFAMAEPADAAWALQVLLAKRRRRLITGRRLRQICLEGCGLPEWLFDACHAQVGDSAETIALLWPGESGMAAMPTNVTDLPLHHWMEQLLPAAAALEGEEQAVAVRRLWQGLDGQQLLVANKLFTGGLRVGVAQGLVVRALARLSGLDEALLQHRLMGAFTPSAAAWNALLAPAENGDAVPSRPYPFCLASPLESDPQSPAPLEGAPGDWLVEWKWDGIRGQLIQRQGGTFLWSRGEELIHDAFPELLEAAACLPPGTVLDGEVLVWQPGRPHPAPFAQLQRRLGRRRPGRALLAECPVVLVAYDLLEWHGEDIRAWPLSRRRSALEALLQPPLQATPAPAAEGPGPGGEPGEAPQTWADAGTGAEPLGPAAADPDPHPEPGADPEEADRRAAPVLSPPVTHAGERPEWDDNPRDGVLAARLQPLLPAAGSDAPATRLRLSPARPLTSWGDIEALRQSADAVNAEGLMIKALASPYRVGRRRGAWWKHKREPFRLDAVLLYAQAGSGRRANLFTDYTFGLWNGDGQLVSFAKAYSGLDDGEILELDRWIRSHTTERFGPVRAVEPVQVFELAFEGLQRSGRHKSGIAVRFPRISRWRRDKPAAEADTLAAALALLDRDSGTAEMPR
jgi:DNA ligase-1